MARLQIIRLILSIWGIQLDKWNHCDHCGRGSFITVICSYYIIIIIVNVIIINRDRLEVCGKPTVVTNRSSNSAGEG